jgi:hypothetical protein
MRTRLAGPFERPHTLAHLAAAGEEIQFAGGVACHDQRAAGVAVAIAAAIRSLNSPSALLIDGGTVSAPEQAPEEGI